MSRQDTGSRFFRHDAPLAAIRIEAAFEA
jgi:hypothetical protein